MTFDVLRLPSLRRGQRALRDRLPGGVNAIFGTNNMGGRSSI